MMTLTDVAEAFEAGKHIYENTMSAPGSILFAAEEIYGTGAQKFTGDSSAMPGNTIACGDNADYMEFLLKEKNMAGRLQLIYIDPPFYSKGKYQASVQIESEILGKSAMIKVGAYDDQWVSGMSEYLTMLTVRLLMMKELLSPSGCIWIHLDWHVVHYVKLIMDQIFGEDNFINEIIWTYKSGGSSKKSFARKHDTLLFYSKSDKYEFKPQKEKSYNRDLKPYRFKGVDEFEDEKGWYTVVNMKDVWSIDMVGRTSGERTGYATQKPEKLMERIIAACSNEGDICADFFAGSGSFGSVCERMNRGWIMCDAGKPATAAQVARMARSTVPFGIRRAQREDSDRGCEVALHDEPCRAKHKESRFKFCIRDDIIELRKYQTDISLLAELTDGECEIIGRYLREDSLSLIKCWSVDPDFDGRIHRADKIFTGDIRSCSFDADRGNGVISIAGYDVFGNRFFDVIGG